MILLKCFQEDDHFKRIRDPLDQEPAKTPEKISPENLQEDWFLDFLGQGRELFRIYLVNFWLDTANLVFYLLLFFLFFMIALVGVRRYRLSRSSWRGIRFRFDGTLVEISKLMIRGWALTLISLGLLYPLHRHRFQEYWVSRTRFGSSRFYYEGTASDLFPIWIRGFLLSLISFGVYSFWLRAGLQRYFWSRTR